VRALRRVRDDPAVADRCRASAARFDWRGGLAPLVEGIYTR
jgi:hypothetical protein